MSPKQHNGQPIILRAYCRRLPRRSSFFMEIPRYLVRPFAPRRHRSRNPNPPQGRTRSRKYQGCRPFLDMLSSAIVTSKHKSLSTSHLADLHSESSPSQPALFSRGRVRAPVWPGARVREHATPHIAQAAAF